MGPDRRLDDVLLVVFIRARDIAGEREPGQGGDGHVGRPANPKLVHPAAPDRDASRQADIVYALCFEQAADSADLDVDRPAGTQVESLPRVVGRVDALVQADRRLQGSLEGRVVDDIVVGQRLLDQEEVEVVERLERGDIIERVRRIGVDLERDRGVSLADLPDDIHVPARRDLQLDPSVTFFEVAIDLVEQVLDPALDTQADTREDLGPCATNQRVQ